MRLIACAVLVVSVVATACGVEQSRLDPNAQVTISGKVLAADGAPLAGTKVALIKELDIGEAIGGLFVTAVTLGIACLADHPPAICANNSHIAVTGSDGSYSFSARGSDTQGSVGIASTMEVVVRVPPLDDQAIGAVPLAEFTVQASTLQLPDLRIWQPQWKLASDAHSVRLSRPTLPSSGVLAGGASYWLQFDAARVQPAWVTGSLNGDATLDSRILEDMRGTVLIGARTNGSAAGTAVDFTFVSGSVGFNGPAGAPPSRGASCAPVTASGVGVFKTPCSLTSGLFSDSFVSGATPTGAAVDLGTNGTASFVVVRGCSGTCRLAVSGDLSGWSEAGSVTGEYASAPITLNRSFRYIRILGSNVQRLRQVSAW